MPFAERLAEVRPALPADHDRLPGTQAGHLPPKTVSAIATRLTHFGRVPRRRRPGPGLDGRAGPPPHIEPYLTSLADAVNPRPGADHRRIRPARRVLAVAGFLTDITEWGWPEAPPRKLVFARRHPDSPRRCPATCPSTPTAGSPRR